MINISAGKDTATTVRYFRGKYPELPIIATGGPTESVFMKPLSPERMLLHIRP